MIQQHSIKTEQILYLQLPAEGLCLLRVSAENETHHITIVSQKSKSKREFASIEAASRFIEALSSKQLAVSASS